MSTRPPFFSLTVLLSVLCAAASKGEQFDADKEYRRFLEEVGISDPAAVAAGPDGSGLGKRDSFDSEYESLMKEIGGAPKQDKPTGH